MSLNMTKNVTLNGNSIINGEAVQGYQASIDGKNPENMSLTSWINNQKLYKENREKCRQDAKEFEDAAFALQDEMIAEQEEAAK